MTAVVLASILQFFIMMRAYRLWDHKPIVRRVLLVMFVTCTAGGFIFAVMTDLTFSRTRIELPPTIMACAYFEVPKTVPSALGFLMAFNILVIVVSIYNALESPRRYENEVFYSLRRDGARIYWFVSFLWMVLLITSLVAELPLFFPIFSLVSSLKANLTSRMHLYIENLSNPTRPVVIYTGQEG
ncbi:uncharacterized protein ARMOST_05962 [Armillaria ostoyae]|uniref:Uncharacterized protein n=1 Tax=Armillaria ostoyae TaxID=47428 RepID=A0A284R1P5_ARMOS|nr:uncharacterized protein ARMOST_05962 [Armillaria ostoyae]